ncbi:hypothetical protein DL766_002492 [Monosporascus sp. MC13-8B]|uniref:Major facilitator superfamily (MFS) profile domain-containing protein n=1 Tax=Monosporascus cannonballus TaxID=155416 RepID=A0ABY0HC80_9PEZI|nr:hypothetical protein DL762_002835 [Monosporascus cannonballus]RYO95572.1 hypothetical protein DL763_003642 [Monosporascus cannonballus]RYP35481.1 hypothetical protein DL766_002492 [Monosporascus sp. MC13-8B]
MATETIARTVAQASSSPGAPGTEAYELTAPRSTLKEAWRRIRNMSKQDVSSGSGSSIDIGDNVLQQAPPDAATTTPAPAQRWNKPRGNIPRLGFCFWSFMIAGMNDAAVGALIPYLETYYGFNYTIISLIFLTPFVGYSAAAVCNASIHSKFGQRGIAIAAPICHIVTYAVLSAHPPFPVLVVVNSISGFGNGLTDACFCAWSGVMENPNSIQGCLHACYSVGALLAPLIATSMITAYGLPWYTWYYLMTGASFLELVGLTAAFWHKTGAIYRSEHQHDSESAKGGRTREALRSKVTWLCTVFFFTYMGIEVGLGGWVVSFMLRVRKATEFQSGVSGTGFWAGMAAGRLFLGFVTERFGERLCVAIYLACAVALHLVFWLVPRFVVSAIAVAFVGFFLGPMFPAGVIAATKSLPKHIHVSAIGFAMAVGGIGGTVFPFAIGAIAASKGVGVLQPIILALLAVLMGLWLSFPKIQKRE